MFVVTVILTTLFCNAFISGKEWCDLTCGEEQNTVCLYEEKSSTPSCGEIKNSMNEKTREDLLEAHNKYRNDFAEGKMGWPKAADMRLLTWDEDLQKSAQIWASQCILEHDNCRRTPQFEVVGQNFIETGTTKLPDNSTILFNDWTDEIKQASPELIDSFQLDNQTENFWQVIWASTYKIGCGEIIFTRNEFHDRSLMCNYGPAGRLVSQPTYKKGEPCTQCPEGTKCQLLSKYPNLCAPVKAEEIGVAVEEEKPPAVVIEIIERGL